MDGFLAILKRDLIKFSRDKERLVFALVSPILLLVVFGGSISGTMNSILDSSGAGNVIKGFSYAKFMFPGIIATTIFSSALTSSSSIVQDREMGFMNVILVSPIQRWKIALGKILAGTIIGVIEGSILFLFAPFTDTNLTLSIILKLLPLMILVSLSISSIAVLLASYIKSVQAFQALSGFMSMSIVFLSGAFIPMSGLPNWLQIIVKINPLTYAVDMMRKVVLNIGDLDIAVKSAFGLDLTLFGKELLLVQEQGVLAVLAILFLGLATLRFIISEYN